MGRVGGNVSHRETNLFIRHRMSNKCLIFTLFWKLLESPSLGIVLAMVVRMRSTRSHTANRRAHHALKNGRLTVNKEGAVHPRHRTLLDGSTYRGRSVLDIASKRAARAAKAAKRRGDEKRETEAVKAEKI